MVLVSAENGMLQSELLFLLVSRSVLRKNPILTFLNSCAPSLSCTDGRCYFDMYLQLMVVLRNKFL
jgi:hypothetical protein